MMTKMSASQTERQKLGATIFFYRGEKKFDRYGLANYVGVTTADIQRWEEGNAVPTDGQWTRLCKALGTGLSEMRATWQRAAAEDAAVREQAKANVGPLKHRLAIPQAVLEAVKNPPFSPPKLTVVPSQEENTGTQQALTPNAVPDTLLGDDFDLRPAYIEVQQLPDGWQTAEAKNERWAYARELIEKGLVNDAIVSEVKKRFGVGVSASTLADIRARVQAAVKRAANKATHKVEPPPQEVLVPTPAPPPVASEAERVNYARMILRKAPSTKIEGSGGLIALLTSKFGAALTIERLVAIQQEMRSMRTTGPQPVVVAPPVSTTVVSTNDIETAVRLILDTIPNLKSFKVEVDDQGEVHVSHTVREVRVIESSGTLKLKK